MAIPSSLLTIVQRFCDEASLARPTVVIASTDQQVRQILALLHEEGRYLMMCHDWSFLRTLTTFSTSNGTATYAVASDFDRMIPDTMWDRTNDMKVFGPDMPQIDRWRQESTTGQAGIRKFVRLIGSNFQLFPTPTATETIVYEYISNKWARASAGTAQTEFLADTDTSVFDVYLMIKGLKWRWLATKGLNAEVARIDYEDYLEKCKNKDNAGELLNMGSAGDGMPFLNMSNVPDTGFAQ